MGLRQFRFRDSDYLGTVHLSSTDSNAVVPVDYVFISANAGLKTLPSTLTWTTAGSQTLTVVDVATAALNGQKSVTVVPAGIAALLLTGSTNATAGSVDLLTITAVDGYNNLATSYAGTIHLSSSDAQAIVPTNMVFIPSNHAVVSTGIVFAQAGSQNVTVVDIGNSNDTATLGGITVSAAAAKRLKLTMPTTATSGVALGTVTIAAQDLYGNTALGYTGVANLSTGDSNATIPSTANLTSGTSTLSSAVTFRTVGSQYLAVADAGASLTGAQQSLTVSPASVGAVVGLGVTGPSSSVAGVPSVLTVRAYDAAGNVVAAYRGTVHVSSNDSNASMPADYVFMAGDTGSKTLNANLVTVGIRTVQVSDIVAGLTGSIGISVTPAVAQRLLLSAPNSAAAGQGLNVAVSALDVYNNIATGYTGTLVFSSTDGSATLPSSQTLSGGITTLLGALILKTAGNQNVTVGDIASSIASSTKSIAVSAASASKLVLTAPGSMTAGSTGSMTVTAQDAYSNTVTSYLGTVHLSATDPNATVPSNITFANANNGTITWPTGLTLRSAGTMSVTAQDINPGPISSTQSVTVLPAGIGSLLITGPSSATAGSAATVVLSVVDAYGNLATSYAGTLHLSSSDANALLPSNIVFTSSLHGMTTTGVVLTSVGMQSITAADTVNANYTATLSGISVGSGAAKQLGLTIATSATAGVALGSVTIAAQDAYSNVVATYAGNASLSSGDVNAVFPATVALSFGTATISSGVTFRTAGQQYLAVADTNSVLAGKQQSVLVTTLGSAVGSLALIGPTTVAAGVAHSYTVKAFDNASNVVTGYRGTITTTSSDPNAGLPSVYTFVSGDNGVKTISVTLNSSGNRFVNVSDMASNVNVTLPITVTAGVAQKLGISLAASSSAGQALNATVSVVDSLNNIATGYTGTVVFTSSDSNATLPTPFTLSGGVATLSGAVALKTVGMRSITISDSAAVIAAASQNVTVSPAIPAALQLTAPASLTAAANGNLSVTVLDAYSNVASQYVGTIHFTSSDTNGTLPSNYTFVSGDAGVHAFNAGVTLRTSGSQNVTVQDIVPGPTSSSKSVAVSSGSVVSLAASGNTTVIAGAASAITINALDPMGNLATSYRGTVAITSTDAQASLPGQYDFFKWRCHQYQSCVVHGWQPQRDCHRYWQWRLNHNACWD